VRDVASWIATRSPEPVGLLADHGFTELAEVHEADLEGPVETRGGIYATVVAAVSCLNVESVARWITRYLLGSPEAGAAGHRSRHD